MKRSTMLPVLVVIVIVLLTLIAIASGRSNAPNITGDTAYPHYVCVINKYCEGENCSDDNISFVAYLSHSDGEPRLELDRFSPRAILTEIPDGVIFESTGGVVSGTITIFDDRGLDLIATSGEGVDEIEHFASGRCDRLITP